MEIRMKVLDLVPSPMSPDALLVLEEQEGTRQLTLIIGLFEARALYLAKSPTPRPLTHDLLINIIVQTYESAIEKVVITELKGSTFHGLIYVRTSDGKFKEIDARPSDAIVIAEKTNCPIFVNDSVFVQAAELEKAGQDLEKQAKEFYKDLDLSKLPEEMFKKDN